MKLNLIIQKYFKENQENVLKIGDVNKKKLSNIYELNPKLKKALPYMTHLFIVDKEGYFRGVVKFKAYDSIAPPPEIILDNEGEIKLSYFINFYEFKDIKSWLTEPKKDLRDIRKTMFIAKNQAVNYILNNTKQIRNPLYLIKSF